MYFPCLIFLQGTGKYMKKLFFLFLPVFAFFSCESTEEEYTQVNFKVTGTGTVNPGEFTGYYFMDGGDIQTFESALMEQVDTYTYVYNSLEFEDFTEMEIYARRLNYDTDLVIRIYEDGEKVKTVTLAGDSDEDDSDIDYLITTYTYEDGE